MSDNYAGIKVAFETLKKRSYHVHLKTPSRFQRLPISPPSSIHIFSALINHHGSGIMNIIESDQ